jgi:hypothetical protein
MIQQFYTQSYLRNELICLLKEIYKNIHRSNNSNDSKIRNHPSVYE